MSPLRFLATLVLALSACDGGGTGGGAGAGGANGGSGGDGGASAGGGGGGGGGSSPVDPCACDAPVVGGALSDASITEASGLAASVKHPGILWLHEDSGAGPSIYAVDTVGTVIAELSMNGIVPTDAEDIAVGPCPEGSCIYVADVGDNLEARPDYQIYRVPEPDVLASAAVDPVVVTFVYEDGPHNCETLLVDRPSGEMFLVTKTAGTPGLYRVDPAGTATRLADVPSPGGLFTAGDARPDGQGVLLRTYGSLWFYAGAGIPAALASVPCEVPVADELQGEAVAWIDGGSGYATLSEGSGSELHLSDCP